MKFVAPLILALTSLVMAACGTENNHSTASDVASQQSSFSQTFPNNTQTKVSVVQGSSDLTITSSYIHFPTNNLYGNRFMIVDYSVTNLAMDKEVHVAADGNWRRAEYTAMPTWGGVNGQVWIRYLGHKDGKDHFSLLLHEILGDRRPVVELRINQGGQSQYVKFAILKA